MQPGFFRDFVVWFFAFMLAALACQGEAGWNRVLG
jgi:hypothetical protein